MIWMIDVRFAALITELLSRSVWYNTCSSRDFKEYKQDTDMFKRNSSLCHCQPKDYYDQSLHDLSRNIIMKFWYEIARPI